MNRLPAFCLVSALFFHLVRCDGNNGPERGSGDELCITSVDAESLLPLSTIEVRGAGFASLETFRIRFCDTAGFCVDVQPHGLTESTAVVCVPPYYPETGKKTGQGTVHLQAVRNPGNGETLSNALGPCIIQDLPHPVSAAGTVTLQFLSSLAAYYDSMLMLTDTTGGSLTLASSIRTQQTALADLRARILTVISGTAGSFSLGMYAGRDLAVSVEDIAATDRLLCAMFGSLRGPQFAGMEPFHAPTTPGIVQRPCQSQARAYEEFLLSEAVQAGTAAPEYVDFFDCLSMAAADAVEKAFEVVCGMGSTALGILSGAGAPAMAGALPSAALLYANTMNAAMQMSVAFSLKRRNDSAARAALQRGIEQAQGMVLDPVRSVVVEKVFGQSGTVFRDLMSGTFSLNTAITATLTAGSACTYRITPQNAIVPVSGGSGTVSVSAGAGCNWVAEPSAAWIVVTAGASGSGNGAIAFSVAANTYPDSREAVISIADQDFVVTQGAGQGDTRFDGTWNGTMEGTIYASDGTVQPVSEALVCTVANGAISCTFQGMGFAGSVTSAGIATWQYTNSKTVFTFIGTFTASGTASGTWNVAIMESDGNARGNGTWALSK